jgi:AcrR family transcriptional regulator
MTPGRGGPRNQDNRAKLLALSTSLFASKGYSHVSVRDLAAELGTTTGAIYSHFRNKGDLLANVLEIRIREDMERSARSQPDLWLPDAVRSSFQNWNERLQMRALLVEAGAAARTDDGLRESLAPSLTALIGQWIDDYRAWQKFGRVDPELDMADLVTLLWSIELGGGVLEAQGALQGKPKAMADFIGNFLASLEGDKQAIGTRSHSRRGADGPKALSTERDRASSGTRSSAAQSSLKSAPTSSRTQERLIDAAMEQFATRGYAAITVRDIARASGLTTGSLYGNFENKAALLVEVIELRLREDLEVLPNDVVASSTPFEMLAFDLSEFGSRARLRALIVEGAAAARGDSEVHERLRALMRRHQRGWVAGFQRWIEAYGESPEFQSATAVAAVWRAELGLGLMEALGLYVPQPPALIDIFGRLFSSAGLKTAGRTVNAKTVGGQVHA